MPWRWGKRLILTKAPRPYRVLCIGEGTTVQAGTKPGPPDSSLPTWVDRLNQRMSPHYEFVTAAHINVNIRDFYYEEDPAYPGQPEWGGAYEMLVEPQLEAATGKKIDVAICFFWWTDGAKFDDGTGWFANGPTAEITYLLAFLLLIDKLIQDGVDKFLLLTPIDWVHVGSHWPRMADRLELYRETILEICGVPPNPPMLALPMIDCIDLWHEFDQAEYFSGDEGWRRWLIQEGHDRIATLVGRRLRQSMHHRFMRDPGRPGVDQPFVETMDYAPEEDP